LKQFEYLGINDVSAMYAGILMDMEHYHESLRSYGLVTSTAQLLIEEAYRQKSPGDTSLPDSAEIFRKYEGTLGDKLDQEFLFPAKIVDFKGSPGNKQFVAELPPYRINTKGFGFLGGNVNYFAGQSIIVLLRYFLGKYPDTNNFHIELGAIALECGLAFIRRKIPAGTNGVDTAQRVIKGPRSQKTKGLFEH
jgi:hypothetical protein